MNKQFAEYASNLIDNLTTSEVKEGLEAAGIEVVSKYSGKPLSEVPYEDIFVGMEIISAINTLGQVANKQYVEKTKDPEDDNLISINWNNGNSSHDCHYNFCNVKVR